MIRLSRRRPTGAAIGLLAVLALTACDRADAGPADRSTPSGLPVPRFVSLKFDTVNARAGPGADHRLLWVYRVRGLPLQVIAETSQWRRVCDPQGQTAWVHKRTTYGRRTVMNTGAAPVKLSRKPKPSARTVAYLNADAIATLDRCEAGWCRIRADRTSGWVPEGALWGASDTPQCRPAPHNVR